ncbi:MAG: hypothetical protein ACTHN0_02745 [Aquihabitans sp.]
MRRRNAAVVATVILAAAATLIGAAPVSSLDVADTPGLWPPAERPADFYEYAFPDGLAGNQDGPANRFADLSATPGPLDADACGALPVGSMPTDYLPILEPVDGGGYAPTSSVSFTIDDAKICDGPGGAQTLLLVSGPTLAPFEGGSIRFAFARPAADQPFGRAAIEYRANACYVLGTTNGFPGDATETDGYVMQAWNFDLDPTVDCSSRALAQETTTTTSEVSTSTSTSTSIPSSTTPTTTSAGAAPATATAAQPVSGTSTYAG